MIKIFLSDRRQIIALSKRNVMLGLMLLVVQLITKTSLQNSDYFLFKLYQSERGQNKIINVN